MYQPLPQLTVPTLDQLYAAYASLGNDPISLSEKAKIALEINKHLKPKEEHARRNP